MLIRAGWTLDAQNIPPSTRCASDWAVQGERAAMETHVKHDAGMVEQPGQMRSEGSVRVQW